MSKELKEEDLVRFVSVPEWLLHDLPDEEQREIRSFLGGIAAISEIDCHGYYSTEDAHGHTKYQGHSFCVPRDCLEIA
jgi:hypothetical protein